MPKSVVIDPALRWSTTGSSLPLGRPAIYELHVKGFTIRHPEVPEQLRGNYSGLAHAVIEYLRSLGVTSVELMPIHQFVDDHC